MKVSKATVARTIILVVAIINRFLATKGITLGMDEATANVLADLFLAIASVVAFWYNNSFTKEAIEADAYMHDLKAGYRDEQDETDFSKEQE